LVTPTAPQLLDEEVKEVGKWTRHKLDLIGKWPAQSGEVSVVGIQSMLNVGQDTCLIEGSYQLKFFLNSNPFVVKQNRTAFLTILVIKTVKLNFSPHDKERKMKNTQGFSSEDQAEISN
jgi:hypothetical protein